MLPTIPSIHKNAKTMKKYLYIISFFGLSLAGGCKKFIDVNKDPNNPTDVQESLLLAPLEVNISHIVSAGTAPSRWRLVEPVCNMPE
jgi:hypothetical protein